MLHVLEHTATVSKLGWVLSGLSSMKGTSVLRPRLRRQRRLMKLTLARREADSWQLTERGSEENQKGEGRLVLLIVTVYQAT